MDIYYISTTFYSLSTKKTWFIWKGNRENAFFCTPFTWVWNMKLAETTKWDLTASDFKTWSSISESTAVCRYTYLTNKECSLRTAIYLLTQCLVSLLHYVQKRFTWNTKRFPGWVKIRQVWKLTTIFQDKQGKIYNLLWG